MILAATAVARSTRLSWTLLLLALVDLCWGMGSFLLDRGNNLLPPSVAEVQRFKWHPLLQAVPIPSLAITSPHGLKISHTSAGTRGRDPGPAALQASSVVAVVGGSSTYDIGVGEGDTWSDRLADGLGRGRYLVINHGVPGYTTAEHVAQTAFYQDKFGRAPRCAVYYVGWNDLRNAHLPNLDPGYADFHLISQVDSLKLRRVGGSNVTFSPALTLLLRVVGNLVDTVHYPDGINPYDLPMKAGVNDTLLADFERNVRTISSINRARGITTVWVGQLINRAAFTGDGRYGWLPLLRDRDVPAALDQMNERLSAVAKDLGDVSVEPPAAAFDPTDFVDQGHFSVQGARRFAETILPAVRQACP